MKNKYAEKRAMVKMLNRSKKGVSGIEMIVSFILFLGFIVFIFAYMNPLKKPVVSPLTGSLANELEEKAKIRLDVLGIAVDSNAACFGIKNPFKGNIFVLDENDGKVEFNRTDGDNLLIKGGKKFYYIINGSDSEINGTLATGNCIMLTSQNYTKSVSRTDGIYSFKKLQETNSSYYSDYNSLKNQLRFPVSRDFAILVYNEASNERYFDMARKAIQVAVTVQQFPIEMLKGQERMKATMRLSTW